MTSHVFPLVGERCNRCHKGIMQLIKRPGLTHDLVKCDNQKCKYTYHSRAHKPQQMKLDGTIGHMIE